MSDTIDLDKVKRNVAKMVSMDAPEEDIDSYISSEGTSIDAIREFKSIADSKPKTRFDLKKESQPNAPYSVGDALTDSGKTLVNNFADVGDATRRMVANPLETAGNVAGGLVNSVLHPIETVKNIGSDLISKVKNAPNRPVDAFLTGTALASGFQAPMTGSFLPKSLSTPGAITKTAISKTSPLLGKLTPKIYNDALVNQTGKNIVAKVEGAVAPLKKEYKALTEPLMNKPVDAETFQKALSVAPRAMQKDLAEKYGSVILDEKGRPQTTLGNLQAMELGLKDDIMQPKYGESINAASYDLVKATKQMKDVRLSQYPEQISGKIKDLDSKFGPLINMQKTLLPKVSTKSGLINTKTLYGIFDNVKDAGTRTYLRDLKKLGVDLTPEIKTLQGWVGRQRTKRFLKNFGGIAAEGTIIGKVLRGL